MLDLMPRMSAEGARGPLGLGRAAILGTSAIFFATASVAPAAAAEVDELKSEMRQLLDRIDQLEQNQQRTQIEVDQIESNSAWFNEPAKRARATVVTPATTQGDYVSGGDFPGSWKLPGSDSSMAIYGFAKALYTYNFGGLRVFDGNLAVPLAMPLEGGPRSTNTGQTNFRFNQSAISFETRTPSEYGQIRTILQYDWLSTAQDGGFNQASVNEIQNGLILAGASIGPWTVGQMWTAMTDFAQYAEVVDQDNVQTGLICRCPSLTYADSLGGGWSFGISLVDPVTQLDTDMGAGGISGTGVAPPASGSSAAITGNNTGMPDIQGNIKMTSDWGALWLSGQVRTMSYTTDNNLGTGTTGTQLATVTGKSSDTEIGWGFNLGLNLTNPLGLHARDRLYLGATYGEGMRGMLGTVVNPAFSASAVPLDASLNPITGEIDGHRQIGLTAHYQHWWNETVRSTIVYAVIRVSPGNDFDAVGSLRRSGYYVANLFWSPLPRINLGVEATYMDIKLKSVTNTRDGANGLSIRAGAQVLW